MGTRTSKVVDGSAAGIPGSPGGAALASKMHEVSAAVPPLASTSIGGFPLAAAGAPAWRYTFPHAVVRISECAAWLQLRVPLLVPAAA